MRGRIRQDITAALLVSGFEFYWIFTEWLIRLHGVPAIHIKAT